MRFRGLDKDGDWTFGSGRQNYARRVEAIKLNLATRLRSWKGDCFFAREEGVDYNNLLDVGTKRLLDIDIRRTILRSEGIISLESYESNLDVQNRRIEVRGKARTIFGVFTLGQLLDQPDDRPGIISLRITDDEALRIIDAGNLRAARKPE